MVWTKIGFISIDTAIELIIDNSIELKKKTDFLHAGAVSGKLKVTSIIFGWE